MLARAVTPTSYAGSAGSLEAGSPSTVPTLTDPALGLVAPDRTATEDWEGARARVASSPTLAGWVQRRRNEVQSWAARDRERSDLIGGWIHDYVDVTTGVPTRWTEDAPEPPDGTNEKATRFKQAWVAYMRQRNVAHTLTAARLYRLTGDLKMLDWALQQLDFYAAHYEQWPLRTFNGRGRMFRHGLDEAYAVFPLVDAMRLLRDSAGSARVSQWHEQILAPMAKNLQTVTSPMTNVALWHAAAVAAIAMQIGDAGLLDHALHGPVGIRTTNAAGITADHIWFEGSLGYNLYVIGALSNLLVHASLQGYANTFAREFDDARRLLLAPLDYRFDDGSLPTPGDATASLGALDERSHRPLFRLVPTWYGVRAAERSINWDVLLDPPVAFENTQPALPPVQSRNFSANRMAVLRAGNWQAFVHYGQAAPNHAQEEALTYEVHHELDRISTDSGTVMYSSPYHQQYFRRAAAHNVPMVDGHGQQRWSPGEVTAWDPAQGRLAVTHPDYRSNAAVSREFLATVNGFAETSRIALKGAAPVPRRLGGAFHTDCAVTPDSGLTTATVQRDPPKTDATAYWRIQSQFLADSAWSVRLACGRRTYEMRVRSGTGGMQRVYIGHAPTRPLPATRAVLYFETEATTAAFLTEIRALD